MLRVNYAVITCLCVIFDREDDDAISINNGTFLWESTDADVEILKKYVDLHLLMCSRCCRVT